MHIRIHISNGVGVGRLLQKYFQVTETTRNSLNKIRRIREHVLKEEHNNYVRTFFLLKTFCLRALNAIMSA